MHYELRPASFRFFKGFFCIKIEILLSHEDLETIKKIKSDKKKVCTAIENRDKSLFGSKCIYDVVMCSARIPWTKL